MIDKKTIPLRLAMRAEGDWWVAYLAKPGTMDGAQMIGQIALGAATYNPERKQQFLELMKAVLADAIEGTTGIRPLWNEPQGAPENERAGHS